MEDFTVSELARRAGVTADAVRHYVRIGLLQPSRDPGNGYKLFEENDLQKLGFIRSARLLGYTLAEVSQILELSEKGLSPCPNVRLMIEKRIIENRKKIKELTALQKRMEGALLNWNSLPDKEPCGDSVCHLIESFSQLTKETT